MGVRGLRGGGICGGGGVPALTRSSLSRSMSTYNRLRRFVTLDFSG